jgi:hypothetical protein
MGVWDKISIPKMENMINVSREKITTFDHADMEITPQADLEKHFLQQNR